jgi:catechol 2,3-dioxygenase-like lactoylglutathione lyase family enzyme
MKVAVSAAEPGSRGGDDALRLFQVSISTIDVQRSRRWYVEMFGFAPSGRMGPELLLEDGEGKGQAEGSPDLAAIQGIPGAAISEILWMVDQQDFFQFELFEYKTPEVKLRRDGWRPCDIGYTMVGLHVADFDAVLDRLKRAGSWPLTAPMGEPGARRICVYDSDGVLLELMEADSRTPTPVARPRHEIPVAARSITLSVPDLDRSRRFFVDTLGLRQAGADLLHQPAHEALWGLEGATREVALLYAGDFWVELVQYRQPLGAPWPVGYQISDQGLFNVGLGSRDRNRFEQVRDAVADAGYVLHADHPQQFLDVRYLVDDQGFSVQLNYNGEEMDQRLGFVPDR